MKHRLQTILDRVERLRINAEREGNTLTAGILLKVSKWLQEEIDHRREASSRGGRNGVGDAKRRIRREE